MPPLCPAESRRFFKQTTCLSSVRPNDIQIDGLDEGAGLSSFYERLFPRDSLKSVKLIVSARLTASAPDPKLV